MKNMLLIFNPWAGKRKANKVLPEILSAFNGAGYDVHVHVTQGPGDGKQAAMELGAGMDLVVCCGGDGTFNETVAGVLAGKLDVPVGYIPAGSTNDFAESLMLPGDPLEAVESILKGSPHRYDAGLFDGRYFTYVASFGAFTQTSYATPQKMKNRLGHFAYLLSGAQELTHIHAEQLRLELDSGEVLEGKFIFGAISNSTSLGGVMKLDPKQVDMRDGLFEVLLIRPPKGARELMDCIRAIRRQKFDSDMIVLRTAKRIVVESEKELVWSLDGEREDSPKRVEIQNIHQGIQLIQQEKE